MDTAIAADSALCEGVTPEQQKQAGQYLWNAANAGSVAAMSKYARDPPVNSEQSAEYADEIVRYRDNASRFLSGAIEGGDVMALYVSWFGADSGLSMLGKGVFERNPYAALAYATAVRPLVSGSRQRQVDKSVDMLRQSLGPEKLRQAEDEGSALRQKYFSHSTPVADDDDDGFVDPADCDR